MRNYGCIRPPTETTLRTVADSVESFRADSKSQPISTREDNLTQWPLWRDRMDFEDTARQRGKFLDIIAEEDLLFKKLHLLRSSNFEDHSTLETCELTNAERNQNFVPAKKVVYNEGTEPQCEHEIMGHFVDEELEIDV